MALTAVAAPCRPCCHPLQRFRLVRPHPAASREPDPHPTAYVQHAAALGRPQPARRQPAAPANAPFGPQLAPAPRLGASLSAHPLLLLRCSLPDSSPPPLRRLRFRSLPLPCCSRPRRRPRGGARRLLREPTAHAQYTCAGCRPSYSSRLLLCFSATAPPCLQPITPVCAALGKKSTSRVKEGQSADIRANERVHCSWPCPAQMGAGRRAGAESVARGSSSEGAAKGGGKGGLNG